MFRVKEAWYIANPDGFAESTMLWYESKLLPMVSKYVVPLNPWSLDVSHILAAELTERPELWLDLADSHYNTIRDEAKGVIAILDQEPPDDGTVAEVSWAAAYNIPIIGYRNDVRTNGRDGLPYNPMIGAAIRRSGGVAVTNLVELEAELQTRTQIGS
ncbi:MAG TPA: nucleoside 2-deoxyribosyltransferase [Candidatus Binatia bacterium]|nr:nucleoside 2-deoxyribosyltransferase [Candidatus Binatia bacterium]